MNIAPSLGLPVAVRQRLIAGLCASALLVFLAALLIWSRGWLQARSAYHIALLESAGVSKSSAVFIHWIHVGRVGEVGLSGEGADLFVEVGFWVSPQAAGWIEAGPRKVVVRRDLMGLARLDVVAVPEGETAPATATDTPAPPWRGGARLLASEIEPDLVEHLRPRIDSLLLTVDELAGTVNAGAARLDPLLQKLPAVLDSIQTTVDSANTLLAKTSTSLDTLQQSQQTLAVSLEDTFTQINGKVLPRVS